MDIIEEVLNSVETCDKCHKNYTFEERQFPDVFHTCQICHRNLCPSCWLQNNITLILAKYISDARCQVFHDHDDVFLTQKILSVVLPAIEAAKREGMKEMFSKIRQAVKGETVIFPYDLDYFEVQWIYEMSKKNSPSK